MSGKQRELEFRFLAQPTDVNFGGKVHGGMVMKWIDQAAYAAAVGWSGSYCVTVAVGGIRFDAPILIGELVRVHCLLALTGSSSMHFVVEVFARDLRSGAERLATRCLISLVALDAPDGRPAPVPPWRPATETDRRLAAHVRRQVELARAMEADAKLGRLEAPVNAGVDGGC